MTNLYVMNVRYLVRDLRVVIRAYPYGPLSQRGASYVFVARLRYFFKVRHDLLRYRERLTRFSLPGLNRFFPCGLGSNEGGRIQLVRELANNLPFLAPTRPDYSASRRAYFKQASDRYANFPFYLFKDVPRVNCSISAFNIRGNGAQVFHFVSVISISHLIRGFNYVIIRVNDCRYHRIRTKLYLYGHFIFGRLVHSFQNNEAVESFICEENL